MRRLVLIVVAIVAAISLEGEAVGASRSHARAPSKASSGTRGVAPGAPGAKADWAPADKHGFGTSKTLASKVWFTLEGGELTEVYYPRLDTPSYRDLQFVVSDGHSFVEREQDSTVQRTTLLDPRSLSYEQINTDKQHRWRLTKTYVADPGRSTVSIDVRFQSLTGRSYQLYVLADPSLSNNGDDDSGNCSNSALVAHDKQSAAALITSPALTAGSCGFKGTSYGWNDLSAHKRMLWHYASAPNGNVVETGATPLTGTRGHERLTLALGFGSDSAGAVSAARGSLSDGFPTLAARATRGAGTPTSARSRHRRRA